MTEIINYDMSTAARNGYAFGSRIQEDRNAHVKENRLRELTTGIVSGNPDAYGEAVALDPQAAMQAQKAADIPLSRMKGFVDYVDKVRQSGNLAAVNGALRMGAPFIGKILGKPGPTEWTDDMEPGWEALKAKIAMASGEERPESNKVIGNALVSPEGKVVYQGQENPVNGQYVDVPDGRGGMVKMIFDPRTRQFTNPQFPGQGQAPPPQGAPKQWAQEGASYQTPSGIVKLDGVAPEDLAAVQADIEANGSQDQYKLPERNVQAQGAGGGLGYTPPKASADDFQSRQLSPQEIAQAGLPTGTVAYTNKDGSPKIVSKPAVQGSGGQVIDNGDGTTTFIPGGKTSEGERNAAGFHSRMVEADKELAALSAGGYDPTNLRDYATVGGKFLNGLASSDGQQYHQAAQNWVRANLRKESGAAIGVDEMDQEIRNYFPQYGDGKDVIEQKARNRQTVERAMRTAAGNAMAVPDQKQSANRAPAPGTVQDGYRFRGGDPADQNSWERL